MELAVAICSTTAGQVAIPADAIEQVVSARAMVPLDLPLRWLIGILLQPGRQAVLVGDLARLLDRDLPPLTARERMAHAHVLLLAGRRGFGIACWDYRHLQHCRAYPSGRLLRGLHYYQGIVKLLDGTAVPLIHPGAALRLDGQGPLVASLALLASIAADPGEASPLDAADPATGQRYMQQETGAEYRGRGAMAEHGIVR